MIRGRLHRHKSEPGEPAGDVVEFDASELSGVFALPDWLRSIGMMAWLTTGVIVHGIDDDERKAESPVRRARSAATSRMPRPRSPAG